MNLMLPSRLRLIVSILFSVSFIQMAQADGAPKTKSSPSDAREALLKGDYETAARIANELAEDTPSEAASLFVADTLLRCGRAQQAVPLFDRYLESSPQSKPYLWQRGIALYFAGEYAKGAKQFEIHRKVNPNDVENAAWHYLCVAKAESIEKANQNVLPAPNDPRIPMDAVLKMLRTGNQQAVIDRIDATDANASQGKSARFYGYLYLGLYADALGDDAKAIEFLKKSASGAPHHYMGDVARVYVKHLETAIKRSKQDARDQ